MESAGPTSRLLLTSILVTLTAPGNAGAQSVSMAERLRIPVGKEPARLAAADVNADGHVDLVVLNHGSHDVTVLLGDGSGGFTEAPESPFPAGARPSDIAVDDFNGDGNLDFAVSDEGTNRIAILLGDGSGRYMPSAHSPILVESEPRLHCITAGDLDEDGHLDLLTGSCLENRLIILQGRGDGTFPSPHSSIPVTGQPCTNIRLADLNQDGHLDIVTPARQRLAISILLGDGRGGFTSPRRSPLLVSRAPYFVAIGDINADENPDVATAHRAGEIRDRHYDAVTILLGDGKGRFRPAPGSPFRVRAAPSAVAFGDVSGDGILDVVTANTKSSDVAILLGGKEAVVLVKESVPVGGSPEDLVVADFDGDGRADIATANRGSHDVSLVFPVPPRTVVSAEAAAAVDLEAAYTKVSYDESPQPLGGMAAIKRHLFYPETARRKGLEGKVVVGVLIDEFGNLIKTQILEASVSGVGFEAAARAAAMKVKWLPAKRDGKAIRAWRKVPVFFRLKK